MHNNNINTLRFFGAFLVLLIGWIAVKMSGQHTKAAT